MHEIHVLPNLGDELCEVQSYARVSPSFFRVVKQVEGAINNNEKRIV